MALKRKNASPIPSARFAAGRIQNCVSSAERTAATPPEASPPKAGATSARPILSQTCQSLRSRLELDWVRGLSCTGDAIQVVAAAFALADMAAEQYPAKWDLPSDYPMIAANYAALRSEVTKRLSEAGGPSLLGRPEARQIIDYGDAGSQGRRRTKRVARRKADSCRFSSRSIRGFSL